MISMAILYNILRLSSLYIAVFVFKFAEFLGVYQ